jgi:hypothetical protein
MPGMGIARYSFYEEPMVACFLYVSGERQRRCVKEIERAESGIRSHGLGKVRCPLVVASLLARRYSERQMGHESQDQMG